MAEYQARHTPVVCFFGARKNVVCQEILKAHGFAYGVQSEEGKGSTFWFEAKIAKQESKTVQKMESRLSLSGLEEK